MTTVQPTMKDVAALAKVSIKTVSRVLNNEPHVQSALRERVREAVAELGYVPSTSARILRGNRSYAISMICHTQSSNYFNAIQFGAVIACQELGYQLQISLLNPSDCESVAGMKDAFSRLMSNPKPDGIILVAPLANNPIAMQAFKELGMPLAIIGPKTEGDRAVRVAIDERAAAFELTTHLLELGHKRIGFVRGKENQAATEERFQGYGAALSDKGLAIDPALVQPGQFDFPSGAEAARNLLSQTNRVTAIFASNDDMAAGVMMEAKRQGLSIPEDLSIVGFDDSEIAENMWPMLTTVRQPLRQFGEVAVNRLIQTLGKAVSREDTLSVLPHQLIIRHSTAPCRKDSV